MVLLIIQGWVEGEENNLCNLNANLPSAEDSLQ